MLKEGFLSKAANRRNTTGVVGYSVFDNGIMMITCLKRCCV